MYFIVITLSEGWWGVMILRERERESFVSNKLLFFPNSPLPPSPLTFTASLCKAFPWVAVAQKEKKKRLSLSSLTLHLFEEREIYQSCWTGKLSKLVHSWTAPSCPASSSKWLHIFLRVTTDGFHTHFQCFHFCVSSSCKSTWRSHTPPKSSHPFSLSPSLPLSLSLFLSFSLLPPTTTSITPSPSQPYHSMWWVEHKLSMYCVDRRMDTRRCWFSKRKVFMVVWLACWTIIPFARVISCWNGSARSFFRVS